MNIKTVREQPLLNPPGERDQATPWKEIREEDIVRMREAIPRLQGGDLLRFCALMALTGLDVSGEVKSRGENIADSFNSIEDDAPVASRAGFELLALGFDFRPQLKERETALTAETAAQIRTGGSMLLTAGTILADLTRLGLDTADQVKEIRPIFDSWLRHDIDTSAKSGKWRVTVETAYNIKALGGDPERIREHMPEIKENLRRAAKAGDWLEYLRIAAPAAQLGLLTPNPAYTGQPQMPPVKRFGGGG